MTSKHWVTILTVAGSITLFSSWLNENLIEKGVNDRLILFENYSRKITESKIENAILETKLWNVRNLFAQDTTNKQLKEILYNKMLAYQTANLKSSEIASEASEELFPYDTTFAKENTENIAELKLLYKAMLDEGSLTAKDFDNQFMMLVAQDFFLPYYDIDMFEWVLNKRQDEYNGYLAYVNRLWFYIIGSLLLAIAYVLHRRNEH
ncbi:MAG: hypothetical protein ABIP35_14730 [Ginsengibacter sp.]